MLKESLPLQDKEVIRFLTSIRCVTSFALYVFQMKDELGAKNLFEQGAIVKFTHNFNQETIKHLMPKFSKTSKTNCIEINKAHS